MGEKSSLTSIEIDFNQYVHFYPTTVSVIFPVSIARIRKAIMYAELNGYIHPVIVNDNHFTLPIEFQEIMKKEKLVPEKIKLLSLLPKNGYYFFVGCFILDKTKKKTQYRLTINKKIRDVLQLKERDIVEIKVNNIGPFFGKIWQQKNRESVFIFFPKKIFELLEFKIKTPYQIGVRKSSKKIVSNTHFFEYQKNNLYFEKFLDGKNFNLYKFLKLSYAQTANGKTRKFHVQLINNKISVCYHSGTCLTKEVKLKSTFPVTSDFFRVMGLIQSEASKSIKKSFCFTNEISQNIEYIIDWFEKYLDFPRELWLYELFIDSRIKNSNELKNVWSKSLKIKPEIIKTYPKKFDRKTPHKIGIMNLKSYGRTLKEVIMRLLECTKKYVSKNKEAAGYFLSGVLAGDGYIIKTKSGSLNYIGISFDPNGNELELYILCLKALDIPNEDVKIYISKHEKAKDFIKKFKKFGIEIKVHKKHIKGFGGEINIFKFRSFQKLAKFNPFSPNKANVEKFLSSFNKIDKARVRFL